MNDGLILLSCFGFRLLVLCMQAHRDTPDRPEPSLMLLVAPPVLFLKTSQSVCFEKDPSASAPGNERLQNNKAFGPNVFLLQLLCLVGEAFDDHSDDVCGAVINVRAKGDKIAIWTTDYENKEAITHIGRVYKERLGVPPKVIIGYQSHADTATKSGSTTKNKFVA